ncbi:hypothetical protein [Arenimonas donghaensis]|uniref:DUF4426 domain-containing protein n=1 Tax=Arenimonas donghaensis DSM 18148 = HO3-R19 TaxID=1121014 RepID=A0A087MJ03_9GAMM|nr:hypothetical protein [Arenimonas donghaensis]KFL36856.1 hypothetical protein N788_04360 [Arenimonas donghaensis DSM 18148 = HO3-R19]
MTRAVILIALLLLSAGAARAQAVRLDDSASQVLTGLVRMQWEDPAPGRSDMLVGQVTVLVRIDTSELRGRSGRIFHVLGRQATPVEASWTARGPLLPGQLKDGERALVYAGPISTNLLEDTFVLTLRADANLLSRPEQLEFHFEFEADGQ